jgi:hypothetical protein
MTKIRNITDHPVIIRSMTLPPGDEMPVIDEGLLESAEVKTLIDAGDIEIISADSH